MHIILPLSFLLYSPNAYAGGGFVNGSVNLLIFLIVIAALARKPVSKMLELRAATIKRNIAQAQEQLEEAQKKNAEITAQLENLTHQFVATWIVFQIGLHFEKPIDIDFDQKRFQIELPRIVFLNKFRDFLKP